MSETFRAQGMEVHPMLVQRWPQTWEFVIYKRSVFTIIMMIIDDDDDDDVDDDDDDDK